MFHKGCFTGEYHDTDVAAISDITVNQFKGVKKKET